MRRLTFVVGPRIGRTQREYNGKRLGKCQSKKYTGSAINVVVFFPFKMEFCFPASPAHPDACVEDRERHLFRGAGVRRNFSSRYANNRYFAIDQGDYAGAAVGTDAAKAEVTQRQFVDVLVASIPQERLTTWYYTPMAL